MLKKLLKNIPNHALRRKKIIDKMKSLESKGRSCESCPGFCCTYTSNSMQISPLEALEIYQSLMEKGEWGPELIQKLEENVKEFRLDKELSMGNRNTIRRYYTCPFFKNGCLGCSLSLEIKPYGCLAFNPHKENITVEGFCSSDTSLLKERENKFALEEKKANEEIKKELGLTWDKWPIPMALLDVHRQILLSVVED